MEKRCQKCGSSVGAEQAFCPTCGAVIGMDMGKTQAGGGWDLASTMVGPHASTPPRATGERRAARPSRPEAPRPEAPKPAPSKKSNSILLAVIGFLVVLLVGGLLILLLLNSKG
ncbi:MAG TPA: zinc-ribbon domain-containing protein [Pyrinomonadaceae bacterium]|jgi:Tfp pilus assembly protein FimV